MALTARRIKFCQKYVGDAHFNGAEAARMIGVSDKSASSLAAQWLADLETQLYVELLKAQAAESARIDLERAVLEIKRLAISDTRKLFDRYGRLIPIHDLPDDIAAAIESFKVKTVRAPGGEPTEVDHVVEVKLAPKTRALQQLGDHFNIFKDSEKAKAPVINIHILPEDQNL